MARDGINPYREGTREYYDWESEHRGGDGEGDVERQPIGKENGTAEAAAGDVEGAGDGERVAKPSPAVSAGMQNGGLYQGGAIDDFINELRRQQEATKPESEEERAERERLERTQGLVNGISDLGRAIANMVSTSQYAPNGYDGGKSLTKAHRERLEKASKEREAQRDKYMNYMAMEKKWLDGERSFNFKQENAAQQLELKSQQLELQTEKLKQAQSEAEWKHGIEETKLEVQRQRLKVQEDFYNNRISLDKMKAEMDRLDKIDRSLAEYEETYEYDNRSRVVKKKRTVKNPDGTTTTTTTGGGGASGSDAATTTNTTTGGAATGGGTKTKKKKIPGWN